MKSIASKIAVIWVVCEVLYLVGLQVFIVDSGSPLVWSSDLGHFLVRIFHLTTVGAAILLAIHATGCEDHDGCDCDD